MLMRLSEQQATDRALFESKLSAQEDQLLQLQEALDERHARNGGGPVPVEYPAPPSEGSGITRESSTPDIHDRYSVLGTKTQARLTRI